MKPVLAFFFIGLLTAGAGHAGPASESASKQPSTAADPASLDRMLVPDTAVAIPPVAFDASGALVVRPSATSSEHDFDFLVGNWKLRNRKLASRLTHSTEGVAFESRVEMHQILGGLGNIDRYTELKPGNPYEGVALRLFDPATRLWSIYWADGNTGKLDPPVVGSFENGIGHFFARDTYRRRPIVVVFRWDVRNPRLPVWSQAFPSTTAKPGSGTRSTYRSGTGSRQPT